MSPRCHLCYRLLSECVCVYYTSTPKPAPVRVTGTDVIAAAKALGLSDTTGLALVKIAHAIAEAR